MTAKCCLNRGIVTVLLSLAVAFQAPMAAASEGPAGRVQDVRLGKGGVLTTRVVDAQGRPQVGRSVEVLHRGQAVATAVTDSQGLVMVAGLRPGQHEIVTGSGVLVCRFWAEDSAPPAAVSTPAIVNDPTLVRGQFGAFNLPMLVYAGATIAALVVGVDALNTADDAQAANARLSQELSTLEDRVAELEGQASP
ncbi:MAG: hypothetical protein RL215_1128 [Planctomycetota bacterium]